MQTHTNTCLFLLVEKNHPSNLLLTLPLPSSYRPIFFCISLQPYFSKKLSTLIVLNSSAILPWTCSNKLSLSLRIYENQLLFRIFHGLHVTKPNGEFGFYLIQRPDTVDDAGIPETLFPLGTHTPCSPSFLSTAGCSFSASFVGSSSPPSLTMQKCPGSSSWMASLSNPHSLTRQAQAVSLLQL